MSAQVLASLRIDRFAPCGEYDAAPWAIVTPDGLPVRVPGFPLYFDRGRFAGHALAVLRARAGR